MKKFLQRIKALLKRILKRSASNSQQPSPLINTRLETSIPTVSPRWESGLVLVCSQCANEQLGSTASEDGEKWLEVSLDFVGLGGDIREVSTSWLGVCRRMVRTVVIISHGIDCKITCLILNPLIDRESLYSYIKQNKD